MEAPFDLSFVKHDRELADDMQTIHDATERLAARRKPKIEAEGPLEKSKIAWKIATYQEAVLWRGVMLARGTRQAWNARKFLVCFLAVRALIETLAVFDNFKHELSVTLDKGDLGALDQLAMNRTFATRDNELLKEHPEIFAINIVTQIDKLGKKYDIPVRDNYDSMSEGCHPNSAGHHQLYSKTDKSNGTVTYSDLKNSEMYLAFIHAPLGLIFLFEQAINELDSITLRVADLHHRFHPRGGLE